MKKRKLKIVLGGITLLLFGVIFVIFSRNKTEHSEPWSIRMAKSEMKRSPKVWMIDFSKRLKWNQCHGLLGKSFLDLYDQYKNEAYYNYFREYADTMIFSDGRIYGYRPEEYNIDRLNTGKILFDIYKKENNEKYKKALDLLRSQLNHHPRTSEGGFWHKKIYPNQMWLEGLYMGAPFYAEYSALINDSVAFNDIATQFKVVRKHLFDTETGLYRHAWDESKMQRWADSLTGQSQFFWGEGVGWYAMALVDVLDYFPKSHLYRDTLIRDFGHLMQAVVRVQDPSSGVWFQVLDQGNRKGNYLESSCSSMFVYCMLKGIRNQYLDKLILADAREGYQGLLNEFIIEENDGSLTITNGCVSAGLGGKPYRDGSYNYYISEPKRDNDSKAVSSFIMASLEYELLNNK